MNLLHGFNRYTDIVVVVFFVNCEFFDMMSDMLVFFFFLVGDAGCREDRSESVKLVGFQGSSLGCVQGFFFN